MSKSIFRAVIVLFFARFILHCNHSSFLNETFEIYDIFLQNSWCYKLGYKNE